MAEFSFTYGHSGHFFLDPEAAAVLIEHAHSHGHSHDHGSAEIVPSMHAAWLAAGTVAIKEWLYHASKSSQHPAAACASRHIGPIQLITKS